MFRTAKKHLVISVAQVTEISMGEFIIHGSALWLNPMTSLGRMRKEPELTVFSKYNSAFIQTSTSHTVFIILKCRAGSVLTVLFPVV